MSSISSKQFALSLSILCLGLMVAVFILLMRGSGSLSGLETEMARPEVRQEVVDQLVLQSSGIYDSFHDPMVGRVLQPRLDSRPARSDLISSNSLGMREDEYAMPKRAATTRVVLLGDSYIFGAGVQAEERVGAFLEQFLRDHGDFESVECLHIAVSSWNILAESAYVRRQLQVLQPDLVIQFVVNNDLDDLSGVRGFGAQARFSPQHRNRASSFIDRRYAASVLGQNSTGYLAHGLDFESRTRYADAAAAIARLAGDVESGGGEYLLALNFMGMQAIAEQRLTTGLRDEQLLLIPFSLFKNLDFRVSATDGHWNRAGHEQVASYLYGAMHGRGLFAGHKLPQWPHATDIFTEWTNDSLGELDSKLRDDQYPVGNRRIETRLDFGALNHDTAAQVHGGIFNGGGVSPYASMILRRGSGTTLEVDGWFLDDRSLAGTPLRIYVDEILVDETAIQPGQPHLVRVELPQAVVERDFLSIRLECSDYVYAGEKLGLAVCMGLRSVSILSP